LVEADLQRFYSLDLRDEAETAGCRRLWVLVNGLPPEASTWRVDGQQWTVQDELLAVAAERIDAWGLMNARLQASKKTQKFLPEKSLEVPRPGDKTKEPDMRDRVVSDPREIAAWFS
jgi:hypothetical protein